MLLDAGADRNLRDVCGETALMAASSEGHAEIVRLLLEAGADKDMKDGTSRSNLTALMLATSKGHVEIVSLLLDAGANPNMQDWHNRTAPE